LEASGTSVIPQKLKLINLLLRPQLDIDGLRTHVPVLDEFLNQFDEEIVTSSAIALKYEGYIEKEKEMAEKMQRLEAVKLYPDMNYRGIESLSNEAREKLSTIQPRTIGQASRISGVSPSDISVLLVHVGR